MSGEDAHLEAAFEDRVSGDMEPEAWDADAGYEEPWDGDFNDAEEE